jgi:hypothetical protein
MQSAVQAVASSRKQVWTGRILSGIAVLFLAFDVGIKVVRPMPAAVIEAFDHLGLPLGLAAVIAAILAICSFLYVIPRTAVLGAILLTGYLGGAVISHLRVGDPLFSHVLFPVYVGVLIWLGLYLREERLRSVLPFRR